MDFSQLFALNSLYCSSCTEVLFSFSMFDDITLDRKKSISIEDLHGFVAPFSPLTNFSPGHTPRKISKAAVAAETMVTINVPSPDYNFYSSNDSVHSAISMT